MDINTYTNTCICGWYCGVINTFLLYFHHSKTALLLRTTVMLVSLYKFVLVWVFITIYLCLFVEDFPVFFLFFQRTSVILSTVSTIRWFCRFLLLFGFFTAMSLLLMVLLLLLFYIFLKITYSLGTWHFLSIFDFFLKFFVIFTQQKSQISVDHISHLNSCTFEQKNASRKEYGNVGRFEKIGYFIFTEHF